MGVDIKLRCEVVDVAGDKTDETRQGAYDRLLEILQTTSDYNEEFDDHNGEWPMGESRWHDWFEECQRVSRSRKLRGVSFIVDEECDYEGFTEVRGYFLNGKTWLYERPPFNPPEFETVLDKLKGAKR